LAELEREILNMRGQYDKDQLLLEQYDRRVKALETEMQQMNDNFAQQSEAKDDMLKSLQGISDLNWVLIFRPGYYVEE
jgi:hypothetical protein